jgi:hypothetical protein
MRTITRFRFSQPSDRVLVEGDIAVAILAAEALFGATRLRIEAGYLVKEDGATCVLESRGEAGDAMARIFAGLCAVRVGDDGFAVEHVDPTAKPAYASPRRDSRLAGVA